MSELFGGGVAAFGFSYQYLQTAEYCLAILRKHPELIPHATLVIEPLRKKADGTADDVVDFAIEIDGEVLHSLQVKSSSDPETYPLQPAPARKALERLITHPAINILLLTNKPISPDLLREVSVMAEDTAGPRTAYAWSNGPQRQPNDGGAQPRIVVDPRSPAQLRNSIADLIRSFRGQRQLSQGTVTAALLVPILIDRIFSAAAGHEPSRISALDLLEMLAMPDARIAQVAGGFDWGLPITNIPNYMSTVPRLTYLEQIQEHLAPVDTTRTPARAVLVGQTGNGKTVLASDYCHIESVAYEFICWIDCRDLDFIDAQILNIIEQLSGQQIGTDTTAATTFASMLGRHSGPWLVVFDGIQNRQDIDSYIPTMGNGSVLVTSNNSLNWWPNTPVIEVRELTEDEAVDCFASYAGLTEAEADERRAPILGIVNRLGRLALAVSMSGIYFRNAQGRMEELSLQYFRDLEALADSPSIPPGFPRTAFAAIQHAVRNLGAGLPVDASQRDDARAVLEIGPLLAPELLPLNLMLLATRRDFQVNLQRLPKPSEMDPVVLRGVLATLRTQTIAQRVVNDGEGNRTPVSEAVAIHPLVHEILRQSYLSGAPPGALQMQCISLMYYLVGWIGDLRTSGEYFAVEQLRLHAHALLQLIAEHEPLPAVSPQYLRVFKYAKALLEAELSTCSASRGRLQSALELGGAALQTLSPVMHEPFARLWAMKIQANMVADLSMGQAPPAAIRPVAMAFVGSAAEQESDDDPAVRALAYSLVSETLAQLERLEIYTSSPLLLAVRQRLLAMAQRDPQLHNQDATQMSQVNQLYRAGDFSTLLQLARDTRANGSSLENAVLFDAMEIVAQLHTNEVGEAIASIERLTAIRNYADYVLLSMHEALKKIGRELHKVLNLEAFSADHARLQTALDLVTRRYDELSESAGPDAVGQN